MPTRHRLASLLVVGSLITALSPVSRAQETVSFDRDIRPILSENCFFCHGPDALKREADLRLDVEEDAKVSAIVAGKPEESELIRRILTEDPDRQMPPPSTKRSITPAQVEKLKRWISQGAKYTQHWSWIPVPADVPAPAVTQESWCKNDLDRFVLAALEARGLQPSPQADAATLLRRITLDLSGLPPTTEEIDAYVAATSPNKYEQAVDRLLDNARFGERMAADWLDVARYADTYGYQADRYRAMWPWRDWVIKAFNDNLPYDQFIVWQLAGDLLPNPTRDQVLATAFNRNHRQTNEGGSVEEEFRNEYVADRVNTFGAAFLGLTLECSRCHDHKYDPISQRDYYQLAAFFNSIDESGLYSHFTDATPTPTLWLTTDEQAAAIKQAQEHAAAQENIVARLDRETPPGFDDWRSENVGTQEKARLTLRETTRAATLADYAMEAIAEGKIANQVNPEAPASTADNPEIVPGILGNAVKLSGENNVTVKTGGDFRRDSRFTFSLWLQVPRFFDRAVVFHRSRAWTDSGSRGYELLIENGKLSVGLIHFYPGNAIRVVSKREIPVEQWQHVAVTYDGSSRASGVNLYLNGMPLEVDVIRDCLTKNIHDDVKEVTIGQRFRDVGFKDGLVDEFKVYSRELNPIEVFQVYADAAKVDANPALQHPGALLRLYRYTQDDTYRKALQSLNEAREKANQMADSTQEIMVMRETSQPRPTFILTRGAYDAPGAQVQRDTPSSFLKMQSDWPRDRLGLASWLVSKEHPLTARVAINRIWNQLWGQGLVSTMEDFGQQGTPPTHPQLLDWLSRRFVDSGWNVKQLIKTILMSATYQQSSDASEELRTQDPENQWLARGPSHRLSAEMLRDLAMFAGGILVERVGGPPVKPYQPEGLWEEKSGESYQRDAGEGSHRRSLYTFWKRTSPPPSMMSFDATSREVCTVRRQVTLTPLQVLVLLNDPQFVEAARAIAERSMKRNEGTSDRVAFIFKSLAGRAANAKEMSTLMAMYEEQLQEFQANPTLAAALAKVGDHTASQDLDGNQMAALTVVAQGLLSYDETVMKR